jgi:5-(carboxyamino)imidazole ribonucleotide synthase
MKKIGIHGNGQLGAMLAMAARNLDLICDFYADSLTRTCENLGHQFLIGSNRAESLASITKSADIITFESENIATSDFDHIDVEKIRPNLHALSVTQDRKLEKELCHKLGVRTADFLAVESSQELCRAVDKIGLPCILKTRTMGYDGKGQWRIKDQNELNDVCKSVHWKTNGFIVEKNVEFTREVSLVSARARSGEIRHYPLTENHHEGGILRVSSPTNDVRNQSAAESINEKLMRQLDYVGVLAVEFFETPSAILVNELAPRVHNSGHWTIEGAATSQFENHIRAIANLPLGSCQALGAAKMFNIVGVQPDYAKLSQVEGAHPHNYLKDARPGRKLGHVTVVEKDCSDFRNSCERVQNLISASLSAADAK